MGCFPGLVVGENSIFMYDLATVCIYRFSIHIHEIKLVSGFLVGTNSRISLVNAQAYGIEKE